MPDYVASDTDQIRMAAGATVTLESLRQAVVPPYLMLMPFIEPPPQVEVLSQTPFEGEGVHGVTYSLRAREAGEGTLRLGFRDMRTEAVTHEKTMRVRVE